MYGEESYNDQAGYQQPPYGGYGGYSNYQQESGSQGYSQFQEQGYAQYRQDGSGSGQAGYYNPNQYDQFGGRDNRSFPNGASSSSQRPDGNQFGMPGQFLQDPLVTNMAMTYGKDIMGKGQEEIKKTVDKYISIGQLKYYFAVDNTYVSKKLGLLLFPFIHKDWSIRYNHDEPVQPRYELNAADLYIPSMAFVTYILVVGYVLGLTNRFSPEVLAATSSSALVWLTLEIIVIYISSHLMNITTTLAKWDFLAFSMYKYVGMIFCVWFGLFLHGTGYYISLAYTAFALVIFLFRTLHLRVEPEVHGVESHGKRKLWLLFIMAGWQPVIMWWLTYSLVPSPLD